MGRLSEPVLYRPLSVPWRERSEPSALPEICRYPLGSASSAPGARGDDVSRQRCSEGTPPNHVSTKACGPAPGRLPAARLQVRVGRSHRGNRRWLPGGGRRQPGSSRHRTDSDDLHGHRPDQHRSHAQRVGEPQWHRDDDLVLLLGVPDHDQRQQLHGVRHHRLRHSDREPVVGLVGNRLLRIRDRPGAGNDLLLCRRSLPDGREHLVELTHELHHDVGRAFGVRPELLRRDGPCERHALPVAVRPDI